MRQGQGGLNEQGLPHGLTSGALNFFLASGEGHLQRRVERMLCWGAGPHQPASVPVYGPSTTPRLQQFVDMTTNNGGMTPFFSLNSDTAGTFGNNPVEHTEEEVEGEKKTHVHMHPVQGQDTNEDQRVTESHVQHPYFAMNTPMQQKQSLHISFGMKTPSSAMGMTLSPATAGRSVIQVTPSSTTACSAVQAGIISHRISRNLNAVTMLGGSSSLATELESAFAEHNKTKNQVPKPDYQEEIEKPLCTADTDMTQSREDVSHDSKAQPTSDSGLVDPSTQRHHKEKRRGKSKNDSQLPSQRRNTNVNNKATNRSGVVSLASQEKMASMKNNRRYSLQLQCHGNHKSTAFSCMEFHVGDHVIFEADRGVDLGQVIQCEDSMEESSTTVADADAAVGGSGAKDGGRGSVAQVVRRATPEEVEEWKGNLMAKEEEAVAECRAACEELGLIIHISDAAFQFDRQKLTFLYETDERVDFRSLLQAMFSKFRCRIWMERINAAS
ncbi:hypothetical protein TraAM80_09128 [Trypanosoma rangeli]|uniref:PSP1 C-terminal domain-containing protein n=1 Tax=Trypanosoma rangeli TaxID=5698 RepID=A0A3R7JZH3_TRYRA|nr:uncharacterized protein TraAM80_09128 [Trypanosoma rangeli]RNE97943.1 hypothetical protein TraAM80_09128 [Trypanosoma rangeli]|eukprot:RNE97943.1 hypothetical protein TraAM80_09128 [Trypanosoma rangeli]